MAERAYIGAEVLAVRPSSICITRVGISFYGSNLFQIGPVTNEEESSTATMSVVHARHRRNIICILHGIGVEVLTVRPSLLSITRVGDMFYGNNLFLIGPVTNDCVSIMNNIISVGQFPPNLLFFFLLPALPFQPLLSSPSPVLAQCLLSLTFPLYLSFPADSPFALGSLLSQCSLYGPDAGIIRVARG